MKKLIIILCVVIAGLTCACGYMYNQLQYYTDKCAHSHTVTEEELQEYVALSGKYALWSDYEDLMHELSVANDLIFYVEEVLDDPYIEDYLESDERKAWAKYH